MSTDQFLEKLSQSGGTMPAAAKEHRRRRGRGAKPAGDQAQEPENAPEAPQGE